MHVYIAQNETFQSLQQPEQATLRIYCFIKWALVIFVVISGAAILAMDLNYLGKSFNTGFSTSCAIRRLANVNADLSKSWDIFLCLPEG